MPADPALIQGFKLAFLGATIIAACGITTATLLTGQKADKAPSAVPTSEARRA
jgi:hypothetical protein